MLFDTHVNLHGEQYDDDLDEVLERARSAGVSKQVLICDKLTSVDRIAEISKKHDDLWRSVGCHPHYAKDHPDLTAERLIELAASDDVVGIGECGLDFHYGYSPREVQISVFREHISASQETGLPLIVHTREADEDTGHLIEAAYKEKPFPILMHCYTSGEELARRMAELGAYFSISGIYTFKNAHDVRAVAKLFPKDRIILETDCPYLAPVPLRGRRNEPSYLTHICEYLATEKGIAFEDVANDTTNNALTLFKRISVY